MSVLFCCCIKGAGAEPNTVSYSQSSLIHLVGPSDCTLHGFVHGANGGFVPFSRSVRCSQYSLPATELFPAMFPGGLRLQSSSSTLLIPCLL
ncbi:hypothetical protein H8959_006450 [Pygathrix nigripes]